MNNFSVVNMLREFPTYSVGCMLHVWCRYIESYKVYYCFISQFLFKKGSSRSET